MPVTIDLPTDLQKEAERAAAARGVAMSDYLVNAVRERVRLESVPRLSAEETRLFQIINKGTPEPVWSRYHELIDRRRALQLTEAEHNELLRLNDEIETTHVERLEAVSRLAELRGVDFEQLMNQLGIAPRSV